MIENPISAQLVAEKDRPDFLAKQLPGSLCVKGESLVYRWLAKLSPQYAGGYWEFYALSNGGFYMAPKDARQFAIAVEGNGFRGTVSADVAGIIACLFALNALACQSANPAVIDRYYQLRDYALDHPDALSIMAAID